MSREEWGALAVVLAAVLLFASGAAGLWQLPHNHAGWIYEYQALIGGGLALAGAAWTVWMLNRQITQGRTDAERARRTQIASQNARVIGRLDGMDARVAEFSAQLLGDIQSFMTARLPARIDFDMVDEPLTSELAGINALKEALVVLKGALHAPQSAEAQARVDALVEAYGRASDLRNVLRDLVFRLNEGATVAELEPLSAAELSRRIAPGS